MEEFNVAVFVNKIENVKRKFPYQISAYTLWYNPEWKGYNNVKTFAKNGTEAKKQAIKIIKTQLSIQPSMVNVSSL